MTVEQLIKKLSKYNPSREVLIEVRDPTDWCYKVGIESVKMGTEEDHGWDSEEEPKNVVLINIGTV